MSGDMLGTEPVGLVGSNLDASSIYKIAVGFLFFYIYIFTGLLVAWVNLLWLRIEDETSRISSVNNG